MKGYIYKYTFPDGKVYIGQTIDIEVRKCQHTDPVAGPDNVGFWEAYQRFGHFEFEVLKELDYDDLEDFHYHLDYWERYYSKQYKATHPNFGYNKLQVGEIREILQRYFNAVHSRLLQDLLDIFISLRQKIRETKEPLTANEKKLVTGKYRELIPVNVDFYDFDHLANNELNEQERRLLDDYLECLRQMVVRMARIDADHYVEANKDYFIKREMDEKAIVQIDKDGQTVREFYSTWAICQAFNVRRADNVRNVLNGKQKTAYGYYWKYKRDLEKNRK